MAKPRCICGCGQRSAASHHVITRQELRKHGGDPKDTRNLVPVAFSCHGAHHSGSRRLELGVLPDSCFVFAGELMGPAGADYLRRYYAGQDVRLVALLSV